MGAKGQESASLVTGLLVLLFHSSLSVRNWAANILGFPQHATNEQSPSERTFSIHDEKTVRHPCVCFLVVLVKLFTSCFLLYVRDKALWSIPHSSPNSTAINRSVRSGNEQTAVGRSLAAKSVIY